MDFSKSTRSYLTLVITVLFASPMPVAFAGNTATGADAFVGGGDQNAANGNYSIVGGGEFNTAADWYATVLGGAQNMAGGEYSFAGGANAHVRTAQESGNQGGDTGTFMWGDASCTGTCVPPYISSGQNQFLIRANGGFALNTTPVNAYVAMTIASTVQNPGYASIFLRQLNSDSGILISSGDASTGVNSTANNAAFYVDQFNGQSQTRRFGLDASGNMTVTAQAYKPGGGSWAAPSDARLKTNVQPLNHALDHLLALRGVTFEYAHPDNGMHPSGTFTGFIAQEVELTFPNWIGHDESGYMTVGPQGFEALTVEALRALKNEQDARMEKLESENVALAADNAALHEQLAASVADLRRQVAALSASASVRKAIALASPEE